MSIPSENFSQFEKLLAGLVRSNVEFAVVGGVAVSLNGFIRATDDVDILVEAHPENIRRMLDYLVSWGEGWARELTVEEFKPQEGSIRLMEDFDLDIFTRMKGRSFEDFHARMKSIEIDGMRVLFLSPEDLISLKEGSWREKDRLDVAAMRNILDRQRR